MGPASVFMNSVEYIKIIQKQTKNTFLCIEHVQTGFSVIP